MNLKEKKIKKIFIFILTIILLLTLTLNIKTKAYTTNFAYNDYVCIAYIDDIDQEQTTGIIHVAVIGILDDNKNFVGYESIAYQYIHFDLTINPNWLTYDGYTIQDIIQNPEYINAPYQQLIIFKSINNPPSRTNDYVYNYTTYETDVYGYNWNLDGICTLNTYIQNSNNGYDIQTQINNAFELGQQAGRQEQLNIANEAGLTYQTLLGAIIIYPYTIFTNALNVNIFGINIGLVCFAILMLSLTFTIIAIIKGRK